MPGEPASSVTFDDERRVEMEKPWRSPGGIAWPTLLLSLGVLTGFAASTVLAVKGILPLGLAIPLHVVWGYLAFTPAHEAGHGNVVGTRAGWGWLESLVGWVMSAVLTLPYPLLRCLHGRHHSHTNDPDRDPDLRASGHGLFTVLFHSWTVQIGYVQVMRRLLDEDSRGAREALASLRVYGVFAAIIFGGSARLGALPWVLLLWSLPMAIAHGFLALVFDWLPHRPHDSRERYRDTRILLGSGLEWLLLGQNYHLIHHLYPRLPFYRYSACFAGVRSLLAARGARIEGVAVARPVGPESPEAGPFSAGRS